jgi:tetratricopeptide (TPR) repeat protein
LITVPIDRAAALRNAEKLLRQGKLEAAIAEYVRVVEDQPTDWNTANTLGDLYARAGQIDRAVEQFARIADGLSLEGFLSKAAALYKKIIKLQPDHEHALLQAGEIAAGLGLFADARGYFTAVADRRQARGDSRGAAVARVRLGTLDPTDYERRTAAASARAELGEVREAVLDLKQIAAELDAKDRPKEAVDALRHAVLLDPSDEEIRTQLLAFYVGVEDFGRAREFATTVEQLQELADALDLRGRHEEALDTLRDAVWIAPDDAGLRAHIARACVARNDMAGAAEFVSVDTAGDDPELLLLVAEIKLRAGQIDEGLAAARRLLACDFDARERIASLGLHIVEHAPDAGLRLTDVAIDAAVARSDWAWSATALRDFVRRVPNSIPALTRLIEICMDGGLESAMYGAQVMLADAYLAAGSASEACVIAEDLVVRDPGDAANIERYRRALMLMNEPDPDAVIAERLRGPSLFATPDAAIEADEAPVVTPPKPAAAAQPPKPAPAPPPPQHTRGDEQYELSANAIDIESIFDELEERPPTAHARSESVEVDLSIVLNDIKRPAAINAPDVDGAFGQLRDEAARRSPVEAAEAEYTRALAFRQAGDIEGCIVALQSASRAPKFQFAAAALLGQLFKERGQLEESIEWLERAADAPAPGSAEAHRVLYELADALEAAGESTRALAICLELQADAGPYRDVAARIDRLTRVQTRG